jgi:polyhydroxyalkanoate synthesis regulator phasin
MRTILYLVVFLVISALAAVPALAQDKPADNMQIVREKIRADKKLVVAETMEMTESEAKAFWPVYEAYQRDLAKINDRTIKLIDDYAENYGAMSNEAAKKLMDEYMAIETERLKIRQSYLPRFRQVLPEMKVLRYYQLENKIQAVVNYELAASIPLVR